MSKAKEKKQEKINRGHELKEWRFSKNETLHRAIVETQLGKMEKDAKSALVDWVRDSSVISRFFRNGEVNVQDDYSNDVEKIIDRMRVFWRFINSPSQLMSFSKGIWMYRGVDFNIGQNMKEGDLMGNVLSNWTRNASAALYFIGRGNDESGVGCCLMLCYFPSDTRYITNHNNSQSEDEHIIPGGTFEYVGSEIVETQWTSVKAQGVRGFSTPKIRLHRFVFHPFSNSRGEATRMAQFIAWPQSIFVYSSDNEYYAHRRVDQLYGSLKVPVPRNDLLNAWSKFFYHWDGTIPLYRAESYLPKPVSHMPKYLRIVSYNVHNGFYDPSDKKHQIKEMMKLIINFNSQVERTSSLQPDILGLQEVANRSREDESKQKQSIDKQIETLLQQRMRLASNCAASEVLYGGFYNQTWLESSMKNRKLGKLSSIDLHAKTPFENKTEGRCATVVCVPLPKVKAHLWVINLQLDVYDVTGKTRIAESQRVLDYINSNIPNQDFVVVMGDFNSVRHQDYTPKHWKWLQKVAMSRDGRGQDTSVAELFSKSGFREAADILEIRIPVSVWSGKRVDFMFLSQRFQKHHIQSFAIDPQNLSDHAPLVLDLDFRY
jgi:endonuclease/exonuclease/phosphatase family metal-dependent hydrolase